MGVRINASTHEDLFLRFNRLNSTREFTDIGFAAYTIGKTDGENVINGGYIAETLADD
jgi:hypothetical protein